VIAAVAASAASAHEESASSFLRGDVSRDNRLDMADPIATLEHLYVTAAKLPCPDAADANDSGTLDVADVTHLLGKLFLGVPQTLPPPFPEAGLDPTPDALDCGNEACPGPCANEGERISCGAYATRRCQRRDDGCLEPGECVSTYVGGPQLILPNGSFPLLVKDHVHLSGVPVEAEQTLAVGQRFEISAFVVDYAVEGIDDLVAEIRRDGEPIDVVSLSCALRDETVRDVYACSAIWIAHDVPPGRETYTLALSVTDRSGKISLTEVEYPLHFTATDPGLCQEVLPGHNGDPADRINIVFSGYGYEAHGDSPAAEIPATEILRRIAASIVDADGSRRGFGSVEPISSHLALFNFWYVESVEPPRPCLGGTCACPGDACESLALSSYACRFPHAYRVALINDNFRASPSRIPARYDESLSGAPEWTPSLATHEVIGHLFGGLRDEYVSRPGAFTETLGEGNCYSGTEGTLEECLRNAPWVRAGLLGDGCGEMGVADCQEAVDPLFALEVGCYEGCAGLAHGVFRAHRHTLMGPARRTARDRRLPLGSASERRHRTSAARLCRRPSLPRGRSPEIIRE
jgi:hypothetical protein